MSTKWQNEIFLSFRKLLFAHKRQKHLFRMGFPKVNAMPLRIFYEQLIFFFFFFRFTYHISSVCTKQIFRPKNFSLSILTLFVIGAPQKCPFARVFFTFSFFISHLSLSHIHLVLCFFLSFFLSASMVRLWCPFFCCCCCCYHCRCHCVLVHSFVRFSCIFFFFMICMCAQCAVIHFGHQRQSVWCSEQFANLYIA